MRADVALRGRSQKLCGGSLQSRRLYKGKVCKKEAVVYIVVIDNSDQVIVSIFALFVLLLYFIHFL